MAAILVVLDCQSAFEGANDDIGILLGSESDGYGWCSEVCIPYCDYFDSKSADEAAMVDLSLLVSYLDYLKLDACRFLGMYYISLCERVLCGHADI
jgi:hypothetical protein